MFGEKKSKQITLKITNPRRADLLPKIISGTSGGAAIAAYVCCRTDGELLGTKGTTRGGYLGWMSRKHTR